MGKKHMRHIHLGHSEKSAVAENKFETGYNTEFGNTTILDIALGYMDCLIMEATEIRLHPRYFNFSWSWYRGTNTAVLR
jgi:hypothetical protein